MKALIDQIKLQRDIYIIGLCTTGGLFVLGTVLHEIIWRMQEGMETEVVCMGSMMAFVGILVALLFGVMQHIVNVYNYAISLGRTRKNFFPAYTLAVFVSALVVEAMALCLHVLERFRLRVMYPGFRIDDPAAHVLEWNILLVMALLGTAVGVLFGSLVIKFGKIALWIFCLLWAAVCIGSPRVIEVMFAHPDSGVTIVSLRAAEWFFRLGKMGMVLLALVLSAVILSVAYLLLRRQQVNL